MCYESTHHYRENDNQETKAYQIGRNIGHWKCECFIVVGGLSRSENEPEKDAGFVKRCSHVLTTDSASVTFTYSY